MLHISYNLVHKRHNLLNAMCCYCSFAQQELGKSGCGPWICLIYVCVYIQTPVLSARSETNEFWRRRPWTCTIYVSLSLYIYIYIYIYYVYIYVYLSIYVYIYIERESERDRYRCPNSNESDLLLWPLLLREVGAGIRSSPASPFKWLFNSYHYSNSYY